MIFVTEPPQHLEDKPLLQGFERDYLLSLFAYDRDTGAVTRKVRRAHQPAGVQVGTVDGKGYLHVKLDSVFVRLHRMIWFMETGDVPPVSIDHRNTVCTDNRWANLRLSGQHGNAGNIGAPSHNTSGYKGVSKNNHSGLWHAQIKIYGKQVYLGRRTAKEAAAELYNEAARKHFGEFARLNVIGHPQATVPRASRDLFI